MAIEILENLRQSIIEGDAGAVLNSVKTAIKQGISAKIIIQEGLVPGIKVVGELFNKGDYYLPELIITGKAMQVALDHIEPLLKKGEKVQSGKFLIGTVKGDIHDLGKNIVIMMLKGSGWEVTDLGVDVSPDKFCLAVREGNYDILGMSTLLTVTMPAAVQTVDALKEAGLRNKIKIMIGGAPVTQDFSDKIGADAYGSDGWDAVVKAEKLISNKN